MIILLISRWPLVYRPEAGRERHISVFFKNTNVAWTECLSSTAYLKQTTFPIHAAVLEIPRTKVGALCLFWAYEYNYHGSVIRICGYALGLRTGTRWL